MKTSGRGQAFWIVGAVLIMFYALVPVAWIIRCRSRAGDDITNKKFWPTDWSFENYAIVFRSDLSPRRCATPSASRSSPRFISVVLATCSPRTRCAAGVPARSCCSGLALAITIFPIIAIATPLFNLWRTVGLYDTWLGLIIPYLSFSAPAVRLRAVGVLPEIPWEMEQAAQVDGATTWQAFRKVIVPLAAPGVFTTAIIAFFIAWNDFVYGISLTSTNAARPVPAALGLFSGASQFESPTGGISAPP
jgi:multiple sugar transport system permease protein